jgi:hypothetical protein
LWGALSASFALQVLLTQQAVHGAHRAQISALLKQVVIHLHRWLIAVAFVVQYLQYLLLFVCIQGLRLPGAFSAA